MKGFLKTALATLVGLLVFTAVAVAIAAVALAGLVASDESGRSVKDKSILRINLSGTIEEMRRDNPLSLLQDDGSAPYGLDELLDAIRKAKTNSKVRGIYIEGGIPLAAPATLEEIRQALLSFRESGKFVYAYADTYSQGGYYVCSAADTLLVNPSGSIDWHGLASQPVFYTGLLEKLGVKVQVFKVGTYKSAVEPYVNTQMSEANREQVTSYLTSLWHRMLGEVAASRGIEATELNALADSFMLLRPAEEAVAQRLADRTAYADEVKAMLKTRMGLGEGDKLTFVSVQGMAKTDDGFKSQDEIAVYYAFGQIITTELPYIDTYSGYISSDKMAKDLQKLRNDKGVKAVVLRVNSPGGSAYASEQICHEVELLRKEKPVVVSMGGYAASGGYYISSNASKIYAEPTTLTGSIGIFGLIPDLSELLTEKLGVRFDVVKTNALSDFGSLSRPLNAEEGRLMQGEIDRGYETFVSRVAQGRGMTKETVRQIGEGRVWTGEQAIEIGLVDELGNLDDAVEGAAALAELKDYHTATYPTPTPWYTALLGREEEGYIDSRMRSLAGEYYPVFTLLRTLEDQDRIQARLPYDPNIY
ncbi:MAG: signal peptide peptidase SppA [Prevotellaceae bacterium]|nr:signal peptide peptidase SppA [Prevotellaceae bacterium]